jgi:hypothetical protein
MAGETAGRARQIHRSVRLTVCDLLVTGGAANAFEDVRPMRERALRLIA